MRHALISTLVLVLAVTGQPALAQGAPAAPAPEGRPATCGYDTIDLERIAADPGRWSAAIYEADEAHARLQPHRRAPEGADAEFRVYSRDPVSGLETSVLAFRTGEGWSVETVRERGPGRVPQALRLHQRKKIRLSSRAAALLDATLNDRCLWSTPPLLPREVPTTTGVTYECADGLDTVYEARLGYRRWAGVQRCHIDGLAAVAAMMLWDLTLSPRPTRVVTGVVTDTAVPRD